MPKFVASIENGNGGTLEFRSVNDRTAWKRAVKWAKYGDYGEQRSTIWVSLQLSDSQGETLRDDKIELHPPEPPCSRKSHAWHSPRSLGGLAENPGVWGHGGGVIAKEKCRHCGCIRTVDTWAQDPTDGEQGLTSYAYEEAHSAT